jgi:cobalt-zinc-cadmium efflux system protein
MDWLALAFVVSGLGYAFGVRSYLSWKTTGDTGLRPQAGPPGSKVLFAAALVLVVAAPLSALTFGVWQSPGWLRTAGVATTLAGLAIVVAAQHGMGSSWRIGVDPGEVTGLVTGGLFAHARNPIFTGMLLFAAGLALMVPGWVSLAALVLLLAGVQLQVRRVEEPYLAAVHGEAYLHYAARTGRFLPGIGRLHHAHGHHGHGHDGHHGHGIDGHADRRWLTVALAAIAGFMVVEVTAGILASSLALVSDAAHMLTDAAAIALALLAMRLAARPAQGRYTYGLKRAEILSAQINGVSLLLLAAWLVYEALQRLWSPPQVTGWIVIVTGVAGLAVNVVAAWAIGKANRTSLNIQGAYQHVLMDALASVAAIAAGVLVATIGFDQADAIATLIVVVLMVKAGWRLLRDSTRILLEAAPAGLAPDDVARRLLRVADVMEIHDLHLWQITSGQPALSAHVLVAEAAACHSVRGELERVLGEDFRIHHTTLQVDHGETLGVKHCAQPHGVAHRR